MMTKNRFSILGLLLSLLTPVHAATFDVVPVAVFDFESKDEGVRDLGAKVAVLITASLAMEPKLLTVERAELEKVLGEQELGLAGTVQPASAGKVGQLTGAKVLVSGRVFRADKELIIVSKIIGVETGRVYAEMVKGTSASSLTELAADLAKRIAATVDQKADTLVAKVETREDRLARIRKLAAGKPHPTVSVKIVERHFGRPVIDPAAETELGTILQECGFLLVSDASSAKPDVEVTGEAFSAFGLQRGNLISCKARVEIKAMRTKGDILAVDRQTSVAVDVTEQTAAKSALERAASEIAERLIPKLSL